MIAKFTFYGLALALLGVGKTPAAGAAAAPLEYNRDIRSILSENCFTCHGADSAARKAKLRLDRFADAIAKPETGAPAIVPGQPDQSEAIRRILDQGDDQMPPAKTHKILTPAQKALLKRWVAEGAKYQVQWSLIAPQRPMVTSVRKADWARNPIDAIILARLEQEKLVPATEADRRTIARRLSLDLTGLPPAPETVAAFVNDPSPDAYEKLVDQMLSSPQWGEHRGRYWLDAARYADTHGVHFDNFREMWTYRDWVINAFNANMPFDQFTLEQLGGDLLPNATLEQQIASGFNRCNITTSEGGAIDEEYLVLYARDRTDTTAQVWLGLTAGCAVCHDHKYDPLSQKEFYQLSAFFNNTTQKAMDGNRKDTPPVIVVTKPEDRARWDELQTATNTAAKLVEERKQTGRMDFEAWLAKPEFKRIESQLPTNPPVFLAPLSEGAGESLTVEVAGQPRTNRIGSNAVWQAGAVAAKAWSVSDQAPPEFSDVGDFERDQKFSYAAWVKPSTNQNAAIFARMKDGGLYRGWDLWFDEGRPAAHLSSTWPDDALKVTGKRKLPADRWSHVCVTYDGSSKAKGLKIFVNGEEQAVNVDKNSLQATVHTDAPFTIGQRTGGARLKQTGVQDIRIFPTELTKSEITALAQGARMKWLAQKPVADRTKEETEELFPMWLAALDRTYPVLVENKTRLVAEVQEIAKRGSIAHVMHERDETAEAYLLFRGEYDKRRDKLSPETPKAFPPMPADLPRNRLGFAQWLLRPEHPLTARVTVNRFWQELFGTGIVRTAGDFGVAGEMPSHPELLDWLAVEFRESGWDVKKLFKLLVTSATYRQAATVTKAKLAKDPLNRLLARGPRFRMDAEMVRDHALAASGLLVNKIGGPSVRPYQPSGLWDIVGLPEGNTRIYEQDHGDNLYRRSVYTFWKRMSPPASLDIFNAPNRETCTVRRERTDTPLQALVTLNDPQFVEAARKLAERALNSSPQEIDQLDFMAQRLIARPLRPGERKIVIAGLNDLLTHYQKSPKEAEKLIAVGESKADARLDKPTLAAYTMMANQLMNLDEVLNK